MRAHRSPARFARLKRTLAMALTTALAVTVADTLDASAAPETPARAASAKADPAAKKPKATSADDTVSALSLARLTKRAIEDTSQRTETSTTYALPDGTFRTDMHAGAVRFKDRQGEWRDVGLGLVDGQEDRKRPKGHRLGLTFAGEASAPAKGSTRLAKAKAATRLVEIEAGRSKRGADRRVGLGWTGTLTAPESTDATVVYPDVQPGVDLKLDALRNGFEQSFVLTEPPAEAPSWDLPLDLEGLEPRVDDDGGISFVDAEGAVASRLLPAFAFDALDPRSLEPHSTSPVAMSVKKLDDEHWTLTVTPDADWLMDPARVYPITVDPTYQALAKVYPSFDAFVQNTYTSDQSGATELKVGTYDGGSSVARSYLNFPTSTFRGKTVMSASLSLYETHSWSCTAKPVYARQATTVPSSSVRWTNQPAVGSTQTTASFAKGYSSSCNDGWVSIPVTALIQSMAAGSASTGSIRLHASETDNYGWKRFASSETSNDPYLSITYDRAPGTPTSVGFASPAPVGSYLRSKTPTLQATVADADGNQTRAIFEVWKGTTKVYGPLTGSLVSSGGVSSYTLPSTSALTEGSAYTIRAYAKDEVGLQSSAYGSSATVTVDVTPTGAPIVTSTDYPNDSLFYGKAGQAGTFTFSAPAGTTDLVKYYWGLDVTPTSTQVVTPPSGSTVGTVKITPATAGRHVLQVQAVDRAGNLSAVKTYVFNVGRVGVLQPLDGGRFAKRVPLALQVVDSTLTHAVFEYRRGAGAPWQAIPLGHLTAANGSALGSRVQVSAVGGYLNWDALPTLGDSGGVVDVRAQMYTSATATTATATTDLVQITVDPSSDGAAGEDVGPGSVNLLTGDYSVESEDVSEFGLTVARASSSRTPGIGWTPQGELLPAALAAGATLTGLGVNARAVATLSTARGAEGSTDSIQLAPAASGTASQDTFASPGGDAGAMRSGMRAGHRYRASGWVFVPSSTGVSGIHPTRGLRVVAFYADATGYHEVASAPATAADVDSWRQLSVDFAVPAGATEAFVRIYNGFAIGSTTKTVFWDDLSLRELSAPFGPAWTGGVDSELDDSGYLQLRFPTAYSAELVDDAGEVTRFTRTKDNATFVPEPGAEDLSIKAGTDQFLLTELDGTVTYFTLRKDSGGASTGLYLADKVVPPATSSETRIVYDIDHTNKTWRVSRLVNAVEAGIDPATCAVAAPAAPGRGCEVLEYDYATTTTATSSAVGDIAGQVRTVRVWSTVPGGTTTSAIDVIRYAYDSSGQLREVWDPRATAMGKPALKTTYTYDSAGRVVTMASPGETAWAITYGSVAGDANTGRVTTVAQGSVKTTLVYNVPLTRAAGGPYDLAPFDVAAWAQTDVPTDATAVFPPMAPAAVSSATSTAPGKDGFGPAVVHYLDAAGREVNTAQPSGDGRPAIDTTEYDRYSNAVRTIGATNRLMALGQGPDAARWLDELGLADSATDVRARALDTVTRYTNDGLDELESTEPVRTAVLESPVADPDGSGPLTALPAGTLVTARPHSTVVYDEGKPDLDTYHLATTERVGAQLFGYDGDYAEADVREIKTQYDPVIGGTSGWTLRQATRTTVDPSGANLTSSVKYDSAGRAVESRKVDGAGGDARTTRTVFWTAGANDDATYGSQCGNKPEWAGSPCVTYAAGTVAPVALPGGGTSNAPTELPVKQVLRYSRMGDADLVKETANGQWRQTETFFDAADRITKVTVTGSSGAGAAIDTVNTVYDDATGDVTDTFTTNASGAETGRIHRVYDSEGRLKTYSDADGGSTTTTFDAFGRPTVVSSSMTVGGTTADLGSSTFAYDTSVDPRGLVTSVTDSVAGTFSATYGPDGEITEQRFPNGIVQKTTYDASGSPVSRTFTAADGTLIYSDSVQESVHGQWVNESYNGASRTFGYDRMGRLVKTVSDLAGSTDCVVRTYTYDRRANRTGKTSTPGTSDDADGSCTPTTDASQVTSETHTYDAADRLVDPGYVYDAFGRTTSLPSTSGGAAATMTNEYYVNDLVASQTLGDRKQTWTLDPATRLRSFATQSLTGGSWVNATSKVNHYDGDEDEPRWIVEDTTQGAQAPVTRNVEGVDGELAATTSATGDTLLQLVNLHGDVAVELAADLSSQDSRFFDEFGVPEAGTPGGTDKDRYGWLGGAQRSGEALGDVLLMGVRLYSPVLGRFLQTDPVPDGNASAYDYCNGDPVNCTDLDGRWGWKKFFHRVARVAEYASWIPGPIGTAAAVVSSAAYYASGNRRKALEMGLTAAANLVGAGSAVRVGFRVAKLAGKARRVARSAKRAGRFLSRSRCNSFAPETLVVAGDGTLVPIEDLMVGDEIATVDPSTGDLVAAPILDVITGYGEKHLVDVTVETVLPDGTSAASQFTATGEHPVWVEGYGWVPVEKLTTGMRTRGTTGGLSTVKLVHDRGWLSGQTVYNLNVGDAHTYLIAGADGDDTLVHNSSCSIALHNVKRKRGVYVIHFKDGTKYVGRSRNMHKRVHRHFGKGGKFHGQLNNVSRIHSHTHSGKGIRHIEQRWINRYGGISGGRLRNARNEIRYR